MSKKHIKSPITNLADVTLQSEMLTDTIIDCYRNFVGIDVSDILPKGQKIGIYKCNQTGYRFYYPFHLMGTDKFYEELSLKDWYYLPWKWEHKKCLELINNNDMVLEVGCGKGDFLKGVKKRKKDTKLTGLELNPSTLDAGSPEIEILLESIQDHALKNHEQYDMVCSFQVLEHISNVHEIVKAMLECLRPNGLLVISVPNNDGYMGRNSYPASCLNMPPHHLGLWNQESLSNLQNIYPIKLRGISLEPLQKIHYSSYQHTVLASIFGDSVVKKLYWKMRLYKFTSLILPWFRNRIIGHSIFVYFHKC